MNQDEIDRINAVKAAEILARPKGIPAHQIALFFIALLAVGFVGAFIDNALTNETLRVTHGSYFAVDMLGVLGLFVGISILWWANK